MAKKLITRLDFVKSSYSLSELYHLAHLCEAKQCLCYTLEIVFGVDISVRVRIHVCVRLRVRVHYQVNLCLGIALRPFFFNNYQCFSNVIYFTVRS